MSKLLYTFMPNKFYASLLNVESNNLVFDDIITFTDQNDRLLEIEDKITSTLLIL